MITHVEVPIKLAVQVFTGELVWFAIIVEDQDRDIRST